MPRPRPSHCFRHRRAWAPSRARFAPRCPQPCRPRRGHNTEEISLLGGDTNHANLVVTDDAGHQLGYVKGKLVQEIPGGQVDQVISNGDWTDKIAPDFFVPADVRYTHHP